jgi:hypothetical protein
LIDLPVIADMDRRAVGLVKARRDFLARTACLGSWAAS